MKYVIDENVCENFNISVEEVLLGLLCKQADCVDDVIKKLQQNDQIKTVKKGEVDETFRPSKDFDEMLVSILLASDKAVPKKDRCELLAAELRALFPKGNSESGYPWRGNLREITLKLRKFFKLYGAEYTNDDIIDATTRYIKHFNGNYTYMRLLKYFILKNIVVRDEEGIGHTEEVSELASWIENADSGETTDWLNDLK